MTVLFLLLKISVTVVLVASILEALVLSWRNGWANCDWKAAGVSVLDFLVRESPLRWLLPVPFWTGDTTEELRQRTALPSAPLPQWPATPEFIPVQFKELS